MVSVLCRVLRIYKYGNCRFIVCPCDENVAYVYKMTPTFLTLIDT